MLMQRHRPGLVDLTTGRIAALRRGFPEADVEGQVFRPWGSDDGTEPIIAARENLIVCSIQLIGADHVAGRACHRPLATASNDNVRHSCRTVSSENVAGRSASSHM